MDDVGSNSQAPNTLGGGWKLILRWGFLGKPRCFELVDVLKGNKSFQSLGLLVRGIFSLNLERLYSSWCCVVHVGVEIAVSFFGCLQILGVCWGKHQTEDSEFRLIARKELFCSVHSWFVVVYMCLFPAFFTALECIGSKLRWIAIFAA